jgi:hypothetical protein
MLKENLQLTHNLFVCIYYGITIITLATSLVVPLLVVIVKVNMEIHVRVFQTESSMS